MQEFCGPFQTWPFTVTGMSIWTLESETVAGFLGCSDAE